MATTIRYASFPFFLLFSVYLVERRAWPWSSQIAIVLSAPFWLFPIGFDVPNNLGNWVLVNANYNFSRTGATDILVSEVIMAGHWSNVTSSSPLPRNANIFIIFYIRPNLGTIEGDKMDETAVNLWFDMWITNKTSCRTPLYPTCAGLIHWIVIWVATPPRSGFWPSKMAEPMKTSLVNGTNVEEEEEVQSTLPQTPSISGLGTSMLYKYRGN